MIRGYDDGANITLLNVIYHKPKKNPETGKYDTGSLDIVFKDLDTNEKKVQHIDDPEYTYYMANDDVKCSYNRLFIEKDKVHPVTCKYREIKKSIAENTGNLDFFYDNLKSGNARENDRLFTVKNVFNADMNIEDYYRYEFDKRYKNETYTPDKLYFDIEVDGINQRGDFPEMGECPINAVTLIHDGTKTVYTLLLENYKNPQIEEFKKIKNLPNIIKEFIKENVGGWKQETIFGLKDFNYKVLFYDEEINLIADIFNIINTLKPDFALAWNIAFDLPYIIERIKVLGYSPEEIICHKDFKVKEAWYYIDTRANKFEEHGDYSQISAYTVYLDQLIVFASRRKGQRINIPSYKLDDVAHAMAKVNKLDYSHITTRIEELPYLNYYIFVLYNIMDTIAQKCIEVKVGDMDFIFNKCTLNNTRYAKAFRQTVYLVNRGVKEFYKMGYILGCNVNKNNEKNSFTGAYVSDPKKLSDKPKLRINGKPVNICKNLDDFD